MDKEDAENGSQATTRPADDLPAVAVATELLNRTNTLLSELESFDKLLEKHRRPQVLGHRAFIQDINAEKRFIERLLNKAITETTNPEADVTDETEEKDPLDALEADHKIKHQLSSTNITSYEAQWTAIKTCRGVVALRQTFSRQPPSRRPRKGGTRALSPSSKIKAHVKKTQDGVLVDAVVDEGREWLKVSAISERQLLFQMARQGWRNDSDSEEDDEEELGKPVGSAARMDGAAGEGDSDSDDEDEVVLVRLAKHLTQAARSNRHNYRHPRIRLVLPKLEAGRVKQIDALLARIRAFSTPSVPLTLEIGPHAASPLLQQDHLPAPSTDATENVPSSPGPDLTPLLTHPFSTFTPTLNIDCTLLVALASDISHSHCTVQPWYPGAVQGQIRDEAREALLPTTLYPALLASGGNGGNGGNGGPAPAPALVCTREAAKRMQEIVATIGTESEVARAKLLLSDAEGDDEAELEEEGVITDGAGAGGASVQKRQSSQTPSSREDVLDAFQALSIYPVPRDLQLPITVVPSSAPPPPPPASTSDNHTSPGPTNNPSQSQSQSPSQSQSQRRPLPAVAAAVSAHLTDINRSIFLHGWAEGVTTLSSNGTVAKQIETLVEQHRTRDDEAGPDVWVCPVARSLVAKKGRRQA
ncbi:uncharacterized protein BKCO1_5700068 [Diplodia corticola]|uniref:DUF1308 domain-containing protein n=1 Tax=Diplodia corticola TaxID=236234 RepID=A0A1J9QP41_9PEZI|nr:uncharacterized protein BKCO1_5700068 [Diplodia corticola]OJD30678.1 hypothetical protein BKCO1_5700068 [Diplodia corticola]